MSRILALPAAALCLVAATAAKAGEPAGREGLYGRVNLNAGFLSFSGDGDSRDATTGVSTGFSVAAGHSIAKGLYLFGEFNYDFAPSPSAGENGPEDLSLSLLSVGPGVAWYLSGDLYLTAFVGYAHVSHGMGEVETSIGGLGLKAGVGQEWLLAERFALGVGAHVFWGSVSGEVEFAGVQREVAGNPLGFGLSLSGRYD